MIGVLLVALGASRVSGFAPRASGASGPKKTGLCSASEPSERDPWTARAAFDAAFRRDAAASLRVAEAAVSVRLCAAPVRRAGARLHLFTAARL